MGVHLGMISRFDVTDIEEVIQNLLSIARLITCSRVVEHSEDIQISRRRRLASRDCNPILNVRLCSRAICFEFRQMFFRPAAKRVQRLKQGPTQSRESVLIFSRLERLTSALS